jgi:hypothetical protein
MATKFRQLEPEDYVRIGAGYHSDDVNDDGQDLRSRWLTDLAVLTDYGQGPAALARFEALLAEHLVARTSRPEAVGAKANALAAREAKIEEGWLYVNQAVGALGALAPDKLGVAGDLNAAIPADASALPVGIRALAGLLQKYGADLEPSFKAADRVARAEALAKDVETQVAGATQAKNATVADTREIDLLDGKVVTIIRQVNKIGRKAFRALGNDAKARTYQLKALAARARRPRQEPAPPVNP